MTHDPEYYKRLVDSSEIGDRLSNRAERRRMLYEMLSSHPDPMWREMGQQLQSGQMEPMELFSTPAYRERVESSLQQVRENPEAFLGQLEQSAEPTAPPEARSEEEEQAQPLETEGTDEDEGWDDGDSPWRVEVHD